MPFSEFQVARGENGIPLQDLDLLDAIVIFPRLRDPARRVAHGQGGDGQHGWDVERPEHLFGMALLQQIYQNRRDIQVYCEA